MTAVQSFGGARRRFVRGRALRRGKRRVLAACAFSLGLGAMLAVGASRADEVRYDVVVDAPGDLKKLVQDNLALLHPRASEGKPGRMNADELRRLFDEGKGEIARLVATEGYYAPTIDAELDEDGDRRVARFRIVPNARTTVESIDIAFVGPIKDAPAGEPPDTNELRSNWTLAVGDVFRQAEWETNKRRLLQGLLIRTYPFATLTKSEAEVDVRSSKAKLTVVIASGPAVRFGPLQISGLSRYPPETVRNVDPIAIGDLYTQQKLFDFQQKLSDSGYFARVDVGIDAAADPGSDPRSPFVAPKAADGETAVTAPVPTEANATGTEASAAPPSPLPREVTMPVRVTVEENQSKSVSVGLGYTTNSGPRGTLAYNVIDFLGGARQLRTTLSIDRLNQTAGADLLFPTTPSGDRYSISTTVGRQDIQNEVDRTATLSGKRIWGPEDTERSASIDYIYEQKDINGVRFPFTETIGPTTGLVLRRVDNLISPSSGYLASGTAGVGVRITNGKPFARLYGKAIRYQPLGDDDTVIGRLELGWVIGADTTSLPTLLLFRAGGAGSVRGYGYQSLGVSQFGAIEGGRYLATGTLEYIHWLGPAYPQWGVAGFVDAGNAGNTLSALSPVVGVGVGARWRSPFGTFDVDVAHGIQNGTNRIHFSLGVAF